MIFACVVQAPAALLLFEHGSVARVLLQAIADNAFQLCRWPVSGKAQHLADEIDVEIFAPDRFDRRAEAGRAVSINIDPLQKRVVRPGEPFRDSLVARPRSLKLSSGQLQRLANLIEERVNLGFAQKQMRLGRRREHLIHGSIPFTV